jgi:purine-binding chemotaxis protein CheW
VKEENPLGPLPPGAGGDLLAFADWVGASSDVDAGAQTADPESLFVVFVLDRDRFGLPVSSVREIVRVGEIRPVPGAPSLIRGLTGVRGAILPVLELRTRIGLAPLVPTDRARIVILEVAGRTLGLLVDRVTEVVKMRASEIGPPGAGSSPAGCGIGLVTLAAGPLVLLDPERIVSRQE